MTMNNTTTTLGVDDHTSKPAGVRGLACTCTRTRGQLVPVPSHPWLGLPAGLSRITHQPHSSHSLIRVTRATLVSHFVVFLHCCVFADCLQLAAPLQLGLSRRRRHRLCHPRLHYIHHRYCHLSPSQISPQHPCLFPSPLSIAQRRSLKSAYRGFDRRVCVIPFNANMFPLFGTLRRLSFDL